MLNLSFKHSEHIATEYHVMHESLEKWEQQPPKSLSFLD